MPEANTAQCSGAHQAGQALPLALLPLLVSACFLSHSTGACILQGKEHQKFCSLKFSQLPFSKRVNKSSKTSIVSPFNSQACVSASKNKTQTQDKCAPYPKPQKAKLQRQQLKMLTILHLGRFVFNSDQQNALFGFV